MKKLILLIAVSAVSAVSAAEFQCSSRYSWPIGRGEDNTVYFDSAGKPYYYRDEKKTPLIHMVNKKYGRIKHHFFEDEINGITIKACKKVKY